MTENKKLRGVYEVKRKNGVKYIAEISINHKRIHLGTFDSFEKAKHARLDAEARRPAKTTRKVGKAKVDLTGKRFGHLVVIKQVKVPDSRDGIQWVCQCDCGNKTTVPTRLLNSGDVRSCGDRKKHPQNEGSKDLTGMQFGHLTVIKIIPAKNPGENSKWLCQCDCGRKCEVLYTKLMNGSRTSCGHTIGTSEQMKPLHKGFRDKLFVDGIAVGMIDSTKRKVQKNNTTGMNGVSIVQRKDGPKYQAQIYVNHVRTRLGFFDTLEEAKRARLEAEKRMLPKRND